MNIKILFRTAGNLVTLNFKVNLRKVSLNVFFFIKKKLIWERSLSKDTKITNLFWVSFSKIYKTYCHEHKPSNNVASVKKKKWSFKWDKVSIKEEKGGGGGESTGTSQEDLAVKIWQRIKSKLEREFANNYKDDKGVMGILVGL